MSGLDSRLGGLRGEAWEEGGQRPRRRSSRTLVPLSGRNRWRTSWRRTTGQIRRHMMTMMISS
jgi:hypothetical protein